jgi:hypothetical protein
MVNAVAAAPAWMNLRRERFRGWSWFVLSLVFLGSEAFVFISCESFGQSGWLKFVLSTRLKANHSMACDDQKILRIRYVKERTLGRQGGALAMVPIFAMAFCTAGIAVAAMEVAAGTGALSRSWRRLVAAGARQPELHRQSRSRVANSTDFTNTDLVLCQLAADRFLHRFLQHILPTGLQLVR